MPGGFSRKSVVALRPDAVERVPEALMVLCREQRVHVADVPRVGVPRVAITLYKSTADADPSADAVLGARLRRAHRHRHVRLAARPRPRQETRPYCRGWDASRREVTDVRARCQVAVLPPRELEARRATSLAALQQILDQARPDDSTK